MSLPTYEQAFLEVEGLIYGARAPKALKLVAAHMSINELSVCSRVSKDWHSIFSPILWSDPLKCAAQTPAPFSTTNSIFIKIVTSSKYRVVRNIRTLVTILDFEKILHLRQETAYQNDWFRVDHMLTGRGICETAFSSLENLRFAILEGLGGFEIIDRRSAASVTRHPAMILLSASGCRSLDGSKLLSTYLMPNLWYLDLSYTDRDEDWARRFSSLKFPMLRILKLAGLRLTDKLVTLMLAPFKKRLWSLDLRNNLLTDEGLDSIIHASINSSKVPITFDENDVLQGVHENPPIYREYTVEGSEGIIRELEHIRPDTKASFMKFANENAHFKTPEVLFDPHDDMNKNTSLTQLYLSGNKFTSHFIHELMAFRCHLQVLDLGSVEASPTHPTCRTYFQPPFAPHLARTTGTRITTLRTHHSLVTGTPTLTPRVHPGTYFASPQAHAEKHAASSQSTPPYATFNPNTNHRITTLTLTSLPTHSTGHLITHLLAFLRLCTEQERTLAYYRAQLPSGRCAQPLLTGLRFLRLEFVRAAPGMRVIRGACVSARESAERGMDAWERDADGFLKESARDFSFFEGEGDGDGGGGGEEMDVGMCESRLAGLAAVRGEGIVAGETATALSRDVIAELKAFRAVRDGRWSGNIEIVFPDVGSRE